MTKSAIIAKKIFSIFVIVIGSLWHISAIAQMIVYFERNGYYLRKFIYILQNFSTYPFFASMLAIVIGIYMLISVRGSEKKALSEEKAVVTISQYKALLDVGAITQEEFDARKKDLLGL